MQAGPVGQLAAVVMDVGRQAPVAAPRHECGPRDAAWARAEKNAPQHDASPRRDPVDRPPRRREIADTPETPTRRDGTEATRAAERRTRADPPANENAPTHDGPPVPPEADAGAWMQAVKAALQMGMGHAPTDGGSSATPVAADGPVVTLNPGAEPGVTAGQVPGPAAPDAAQVQMKAGSGLGAAVPDVPSPPTLAEGTQAVGQDVPEAVQDGSRASATAPTSQAEAQAQASAAAATALRSSVGPGETVVAASGAGVENDGGAQASPVSPAARRAVDVFRGAAAAGTQGAKTPRSKTAAATKAFAVERVGGRTVVSGGKEQAAATIVAGVTASGTAAQRTGAGQGQVGLSQLPQGTATGDVADQVAESIRASGAPTGRQIVVQLQPPDLGRVRIVFRSVGDAVRGVVRVDNPETLSRLEREAAPLMQRLASSGIDVRRLDMMLSDSQGDDMTQNPAFREGQGRQNGWVAEDPSGNPSGEAFADAGQTTAGSETADPGAGIGGGAINVRI